MEMQASLSPYINLRELQRYFEHFSQSAVRKESWLEMNGNPIAWDIPLSVAISLYGKANNDDKYPIEIVLHQRNCPNSILKLENMSQLKSRILHSLKDVLLFFFTKRIST